MKIQMLGSVNVTLRDRPVGPSSSRAKLLLATLAWQPNEYVSDEVVIDRIWGDELPQRPRDTLYTCANRLRKCLDATNGSAVTGRVMRHRGGYVLECDPDMIDLHQFRQLASSAQDAVHRGDDRAAADLFGQAMAAWSGTALCDVESPWAGRVRTALSRELLTTRIGWARSALELGRQAELLPHLSSLVEENPFDEAIAGLHMLALHRAGRRKEAWEFYARLRTRLVEHLGEEPGSELQELHRTLLQREDRSDAPRRDVMPLPRQLPPPVHRLNGHSEVLSQLRALVPQASHLTPPVVIQGPAGVGKTALALHWAHDVAHHFPDGQLYVHYCKNSTGGRPTPVDLLPGLLTALGVVPGWVPPGKQAQTALYRSLVADRRMLVIIDGVIDDYDALPFLPGTPESMVVVTSRTALPVLTERYDARHFSLVNWEPRAQQRAPRTDTVPEHGLDRISSVLI
ncbi:BTAD domain-containing putative transcriptional regulator [Streptomyces decoyicus]|uniref:AfsR/SARP family transcriptional regulator n=1 Tax=Streptomyces decoyicus TaxID=249567 RepID=UPI003626CC01